jgi:hypothetical protein
MVHTLKNPSRNVLCSFCEHHPKIGYPQSKEIENTNSLVDTRPWGIGVLRKEDNKFTRARQLKDKLVKQSI